MELKSKELESTGSRVRKITRRKFLVGLGAAAAVIAAGGPELYNIFKESSRKKKWEEIEKLAVRYMSWSYIREGVEGLIPAMRRDDRFKGLFKQYWRDEQGSLKEYSLPILTISLGQMSLGLGAPKDKRGLSLFELLLDDMRPELEELWFLRGKEAYQGSFEKLHRLGKNVQEIEDANGIRMANEYKRVLEVLKQLEPWMAEIPPYAPSLAFQAKTETSLVIHKELPGYRDYRDYNQWSTELLYHLLQGVYLSFNFRNLTGFDELPAKMLDEPLTLVDDKRQELPWRNYPEWQGRVK